MLDRIEFVLSEAFTSLRRNTWMTFAAVTTAAMALFILGGLAYAYARTTAFAASLESRFEMKVFLRPDVSEDNAMAIGPKLQGIPGVAKAVFTDKQAVLDTFLKEHPGIEIKGLDLENPMPDTYTITFSDLKLARKVADKVQTFESVEKVSYLGEEQDFLENMLSGMRWMGLVLGGLMLLTSGILIYNTIRLTIIARRKEIIIMQLVGATRGMVWTPMLLEGVVQGTIGGLFATIVLWGAYTVTTSSFKIGQSVNGVRESFPLTSVGLGLLTAGALYGLVCSLIAVREPKPRKAS